MTHPSTPAPPRPFTVLVVCTGNICRSPAVERLLTAALGDDSGITVTSAGTRAMVGHPISEPMVPLLTEAGAGCDAFAARQLTEAMVRDADVVLALTRAHRSAVVELYPGAVRRTFTLRELARLIEGIDPSQLPSGTPAERFAALLPLAAAQRGARMTDPADDDVVDPYGRGDDTYATSFAQLHPAVTTIASAVRT